MLAYMPLSQAIETYHPDSAASSFELESLVLGRRSSPNELPNPPSHLGDQSVSLLAACCHSFSFLAGPLRIVYARDGASRPVLMSVSTLLADHTNRAGSEAWSQERYIVIDKAIFIDGSIKM